MLSFYPCQQNIFQHQLLMLKYLLLSLHRLFRLKKGLEIELCPLIILFHAFFPTIDRKNS